MSPPIYFKYKAKLTAAFCQQGSDNELAVDMKCAKTS